MVDMRSNLAVLGLLLAASAAAQTPSSAPTTNAPPVRRMPVVVRSPEIGTDRTVTFRLRAPQAREVSVNGQWPNGRVTLTRGSNDVWSATTAPIEPGVWEYSLTVDGLSMIDPGNPAIKPMREPRTSILHVPGETPLVHDFQDVPHGTVRAHTYRSKVLGRLRGLAVYTPPDYERRRGKYPTLYLQHGSGDNQDTWVAHGKAHWILDNLIAAGKVKPMVVVMMDGHAAVGGAGGAFQDNTALFERDLLEEVMPLVEATYRVRREASSRGIVGLSMGGGQSLSIGLRHTDLFAWVGGFSSAPPSKENVAGALDDASVTNRRLKLLWIGCGKDDFLLKRNQEFIQALEEKKVRHTWSLTEGNHSWPVWRGYLAEFTPLLFR